MLAESLLIYKDIIRPPPLEIWKDGNIEILKDFPTIDSFDKNNRFFWAKESVVIETSPKMSNP